MIDEYAFKSAIASIRAKKMARLEKELANGHRTMEHWRWVGKKWHYRGDYIRGRPELVIGLPHVYENTCPRYLLSRSELRNCGLKPGRAQQVAHTYNAMARRYFLYDIRDCTRIGGDLALARLQRAIENVEKVIELGQGRDILLQALREFKDIPF